MKKHEKNTLIKSIINLAYKGKIEEAQQLMTSEVSELEILEKLTHVKINEKVYSFIQTFKEPNWNKMSTKIIGQMALDFFHYANKNNIDLFKFDSQNSSIFMSFFKNSTNREIENIIQVVDEKKLVNAFLTEDIDLDNILMSMLSKDYGYSGNMMFSPTSASKMLLKKLSSSEFISSEKYKKLFTEKSLLNKYLLNKCYFDTLTEVLEQSKEFFGQYAKVLLDTKLIKTEVNNERTSVNQINYLNQMMSEKSCLCNFNLLSVEDKDNYENGHWNLNIQSNSYATFKKLLVNGFFDVKKFNQPESQEVKYTVFERFLLNNFNEGNFFNIGYGEIEKVIELVKNIIKEANDLTNYGIEKKCIIKTSVQIKDLLNTKFKEIGKMQERSLDDDVFELSYVLKVDPSLANKILEVLDKRYNFSKNNQLNDIKSKANNEERTKLKESWDELISSIIFTKDLEIVTEETKQIRKRTRNI